MLKAARGIAAVGTVVCAESPAHGPASIESHVDEALAVPGILEVVARGESLGVTGYVIACFGDTGIAAAREVARGPVVGMTEAAMYAASILAPSFSIITLPPRTIAQAERVVVECGMERRCRRIRAIDVAVGDCIDLDEAIEMAMLAEARAALAQDGAEAIILGCAGLSNLVAPMSRALSVPVIDGVSVAFKMVEGLAALGLSTSKHRSYGYPLRLPAWGD
jgi:allantoin racemase